MIIIMSVFFSYLFCMMYLNAVGFFDDIFLNSNENIIVSMFKFLVVAIFPYIVAPYIFYQRNGNLFARRNKPINPCVVVDEPFDIERNTSYDKSYTKPSVVRITKPDIEIFNEIVKNCEHLNLSYRELAFVICGSGIYNSIPTSEDVNAFRNFQSKGIVPDSRTDGFERMCCGQAQIESKGDLCSGYIRKRGYFSGNQNMEWEGTFYWDQYPTWFTKILLHWHPKYR